MQHGQAVDTHQILVSAIQRVEVSRAMVVKIHAYDDSIESAAQAFSAGSCTPGITSSTDLPVSCMWRASGQSSMSSPQANPPAGPMHRLEAGVVTPGSEHAAPCQMGKVGLPGDTVRVLEPYPVSFAGFHVSRSNHLSCSSWAASLCPRNATFPPLAAGSVYNRAMASGATRGYAPGRRCSMGNRRR